MANNDEGWNFAQQGTLTKKDLLEFYTGEDIKDKYRLIEKEINEL